MEQDLTREAERAISGDAEALERLWEGHRRWAAAVLLAHKPPDVDLDDLLQDIAMTLVRKIQDLRDPALFKPWLRTLAVNAAKTAGRRRKVRLRLTQPGREIGLEEIPSQEDGREAAQAEGRRVLELAQRLHPDYREPLLLRCVRGMSHRQISEILDLPITTIETRIARARRMLREEIEFENDASSLRIARGGIK